MQKKALLALMLALTMLLSSCALIQKDPAVDAATEIIRVGDTVYTKAEVQYQIDYQLDYMAYMYSMYGMSYDVTDPANIAEAQTAVIDSLVEEAVRAAKAKELGLDQLTEEEKAELQTTVDETVAEYREYIDNFYITDDTLEGEALEAEIDRLCAEMGVDAQTVTESETMYYLQDKLYNHVTGDVTVSEEEIQADFDAKVASEKENYASDLSAYGYNVNNGTTVYYRPAGYRMVKQILVQFSEEDQAAIDEANTALTEAQTASNTALTALTDLGVEEPVTLSSQVSVTLDPATGELVEAVAAFTEEQTQEVAAAAQELAVANAYAIYCENKVAEVTAAAFANIDAEADDVLAQLEAGADWDTLMAEKTDDPGMQGETDTAKNGYAVCADYYYFDESFTAAAMAIPEVGQWSPKTEGSYGYYIVYYASEVAEGAVALDDVREELSATLLATKQETKFNDTVAEWVAAADVKIDTKALED